MKEMKLTNKAKKTRYGMCLECGRYHCVCDEDLK